MNLLPPLGRAAVLGATVLTLALSGAPGASADTTQAATAEPEVTNWGTLGTNQPVTVIYGLDNNTVTLGNREHHAGHAVKSASALRVMDGGGNVCWRAGTYVPLSMKDATVGVYTVDGC